ncbi:transmembrane protein 225 isoform X2 [Camelus ferus]|uniref:Transmembrane protein 225 isoform X2 n=1 Tax=Camelus ferus TaxID=419612 RepID=A0A8B8SEJ6_CAMFR|nr:transmembrane protein 225 isoform X2 [Camelus ferus]
MVWRAHEFAFSNNFGEASAGLCALGRGHQLGADPSLRPSSCWSSLHSKEPGGTLPDGHSRPTAGGCLEPRNVWSCGPRSESPGDGLKVVRDMMLLVFSLSLLHNLLLGLEFTYMIPQTKHILFMTASLSFFTAQAVHE